MEDDNQTQIGRVLSRYPIILVILGGLLAAVAMGSWIGTGDMKKVGLLIGGCGAVAAVMMLGDKYWLMIPFAFTFQLRAIPYGHTLIQLPEIVICVCTATFIARYALKLQKFTLFRASHVPVMLYVAWAAFIFVNYPVGLAQQGATTGGARSYAKILMALAAFLVMANQTITTRDCWRIVALVLVGGFFQAAQGIFLFFYGGTYGALSEADISDPDSYYSWHQNLGIVPSFVIPMIFARYKSSEMFSVKRPWIIPVLLACLVLVLLSGKRVIMISLPLCAISASLIRKEWGFLMLWIGGALLAMVFVILGHGTLFTLPLAAQRALTWLPAQWDSQLAGYKGGADPFREKMRELAMDRIKRDPWIGRGYQVDLKMINQAFGAERNSWIALCVSLAIGSQWHNTWLGDAADFGIPASVFQALIYLQAILLGLWLFKHLPGGSSLQTIAFYVLLITIRNVAGSWHAGHSGQGPFDQFWMYGMLVSLAVMVKAASTQEKKPVEERTPPSPGGFRRPLPGGYREPLPRPVLHRSARDAR